MKNIFTAVVICSFLMISCKKETSDKGENTASAKAKTETPNVSKTDFKHSLAQWSLNKPFKDGTLDPMDFPQIAKDLGFSGVEYVTQLYPSVLETGANYKERVMTLVKELNARSQKAGIDNVLIMVDHAGELADPDPAKLKEAVANHKIWMDAAALMGAHSVRANLFGELDPEKWHALSVASLKELGAYGKKVGVNIVIENHGGWSSDAAKLVAVMKEVNMETVGTLPDFGNFCVKREGGERWGAPCILEYDTYKGTEELMEYAVGASAKAYSFDTNGDETKLDYQRLMQIVNDHKTDRFKGYVGTEYEGDLEDPKKGVKLTKALVQKSIDNLK